MKLLRTLIWMALLFVPLAARAQDNTEVLQKLEEKCRDLKVAYANASTQYGPASPEAAQLSHQLVETRLLMVETRLLIVNERKQKTINVSDRPEPLVAQQSQSETPAPFNPPPRPMVRREMRIVDRPGAIAGYEPLEGVASGSRLGAWWKNSEIVSKLQLSDEQVKKISQTFLDHRLKLIDLRADVDKHELRLQPLLDLDQADESKVGVQIDLITTARGKLEKENAMMMLDIRRWLSVEQWKKLKSIEATAEESEMRDVFFTRTVGPQGGLGINTKNKRFFTQTIVPPGCPGVSIEGPPPQLLPEDVPVIIQH